MHVQQATYANELHVNVQHLWRFSCVVCSWLGFISQFQIKKNNAHLS